MTISDTVEVVPAPNAFFDADGPFKPLPLASSRTARDSALGVAYAERLAAYQHALDEGRRSRWGNTPANRYPAVQVSLPGGPVTVTLDPDLDRQLLRLYGLHGWAGVATVETAVTRSAADPRRRFLYPWEAVQGFFRFARNRLLLQIRDALVTIERHAADQVVLQLNQTVQLVSDTLVQLKLETTTIGPSGVEEMVPSPSWDTPLNLKRVFYRIGNRPLAERLYPVVSRAVRGLDDVRLLQSRVKDLEKAIRAYGADEPLLATREDLAEAKDHLTRVSAGLEQLMQDVAAVLPLAVLVLPLLTGPFNQAMMEHRLGEVVKPLQSEPERIARGINAGGGRIAALITDWDGVTEIEQLFAADEGLLEDAHGLENAVVARALDRAVRQPAYLPLLSERALDRLVDPDGPVAADSFEFMVWGHYKAELITAVEDERASVERTAAVVAAIEKLAAFMSLLLLLTPAGVLSRFLLGAIGLGLLAFQACSVVHMLSIIDRDVDLALIDLDRTNLRTLYRLSELQSMRKEYVEQIAAQGLAELGLVIAAGAFGEFKLLLHWRGYYFDLQTLVQG